MLHLRIRSICVLLLVAALAAAGAGTAAVKLPAVNAARAAALPTAALTGTVKSRSKIIRILAIDRAWADVLKTSQPDPSPAEDPFVYEAQLDPATGAFRIEKLLPNRPYDLIVWTQDATGTPVRWEGATMDYHRAIRLSTPATDEDRKSIEGLVTEPPQFYDKARVLHIAADHQHAAVLVELMRTRDFHSDTGGEVIYRVELWYFENLFGGWAKDKNTEKVLARIRGRPEAPGKVKGKVGESGIPNNWQFMPELGGLTAGQDSKTIVLPEKPDPKHGLAGSLR